MWVSLLLSSQPLENQTSHTGKHVLLSVQNKYSCVLCAECFRHERIKDLVTLSHVLPFTYPPNLYRIKGWDYKTYAE